MFKALFKAAWKRTYESAPWDYFGYPPKLKHSFFGLPHKGTSSTHILDYFAYFFQAPFLISKNIFKLFTELPLAFLRASALKTRDRIRASSYTHLRQNIFLFLLIPIGLPIFAADFLLRTFLTSPIVVIKELGKNRSKFTRGFMKAAIVGWLIGLSIIAAGFIPMLGGVFASLSVVTAQIGQGFFLLQYAAFKIRKACSKHLKAAALREQLSALLEQLQPGGNRNRSEETALLSGPNHDPVAERFKDFDPNSTRCALTSKLLGINEDNTQAPIVVRALHQNQYKYYDLNALLTECSRLKNLGALASSEMPTFDEQKDRVPIHYQYRLEAKKTQCPLTLETFEYPSKTWYRSIHGHYYIKESENSAIHTLLANQTICPVTKKYLSHEGLKKVNMSDVMSNQIADAISKNQHETHIKDIGLFKRRYSHIQDLPEQKDSLKHNMSFY